MKIKNAAIIILFVAAALLRFADVFRPVNNASWREADIGSISRNFDREGLSLFYPRIDWRGLGPGYAEMEFPAFPFFVALTYKIFGEHDQIGRIWAFLFSLGAMFVFYKFAREYLKPFPATVAFAFFALNPLVVETATSLQPEGLMLLTYIAAAYFFLRWLKYDRNLDLVFATAATAAALLAKAPSAHIGLFFGVMLFEKFGIRLVLRPKVWFFGLASIVPPALWYFHAKNLWLTYGNSLGVSNEYHWIGWDFFTDPNFIAGIVRSEFVYVWITFGIVVGVFAIWRGFNEPPAKYSLLWLASIFAFYLLAARTTSEDWAHYYHVFSIPPVAILFGFSINKLWDYAREFADRYSLRSLAGNLVRVGVILSVIAAILASLLVEARQVRANFIEKHEPVSGMLFAERVAPMMTEPGLILVSGGRCFTESGYQLAYNASYMFYWLDRKGWNICVEQQSPERVAEFARQGARYFVGEKKYLKLREGVEDSLRATYPVIADGEDHILFDLGRDYGIR